MRAVWYLRETRANDIDVQSRALRAHAAREDLSCVRSFVDGSDASDEDAPEFRRMLAVLNICPPDSDGAGPEPRPLTAVAIADVEVLGTHALARVRRVLQLGGLGVPLRVAKDPDIETTLLDAWRERGPSERRREQVRAAMQKRALRGEVLGRAPYGYRAGEAGLEVDDVEAEVVRRMFHLALRDDLGVRRIAQRLNEARSVTRGGGPWSMVTLRSMLRNPVYSGTYRRLGVVVPGAHEALVSRSDFAAVQRRLDSRRTPRGARRRHRYLLSGLAVCGHCGNRMIGVTRRRRGLRALGGRELRYYQCESRANHSRCAYHTRRTEELEAAVVERLDATDRATTALACATGPSRSSSESAQVVRARLEARRASLRRRLEWLVEQRASGQTTSEQFHRAAQVVALDDLEAEFALSSIAAAEDDRQPGSEDRPSLPDVSGWDGLDFADRRALLLQAIDRVVVTDDTIRVELAG